MSKELYTSPSIQHQERIAALPFVENRAMAETWKPGDVEKMTSRR